MAPGRQHLNRVGGGTAPSTLLSTPWPTTLITLCRVQELLELIELPSLGGRFPPQLSGGQRQRGAVARALACNPRLLLLDEPFGALDPIVRKALRAGLKQLVARLGVTTAIVTHDQVGQGGRMAPGGGGGGAGGGTRWRCGRQVIVEGGGEQAAAPAGSSAAAARTCSTTVALGAMCGPSVPPDAARCACSSAYSRGSGTWLSGMPDT